MRSNVKRPTGLGVDSSGGQVVDPTKNVLDLVEAKSKSAEELRETDRKYNELDRKWNFQYWSDLRTADLQAHREMRLLEKEIVNLHMMRIKDAGEKEAERLNDIRAGATQQAARLASDLVSSQELARKLVETTATTLSGTAAGASASVNDRLTKIEQTQYTTAGKTGATDPVLAQYMAQTSAALESLANNQTRSGGEQRGKAAVANPLINVFLVVGTALIVFLIEMAIRGKP